MEFEFVSQAKRGVGLQPGSTNGSDLSRSTTLGFIWLSAQSLAVRGTNFLTQLVLARLLLPEAFGQVGLAFTVTAIVTSVINVGVDDILLQRMKNLKYWVTCGFFVSFFLSLVSAVLMMTAAPFAAKLYNSPSLVGLIFIVALAQPLNALSTIPAVKLRAELNFKYLATYASVETVCMGLTSIMLAAFGFGTLSFVLPFPISGLVKALFYWRRAPVNLRKFKNIQVKYIMGSSGLILASRLLVEVVGQGDYIVLGLMTSEKTVGMYFFAFRLAIQPIRMLAGNFSTVLFPALAQLQNDPARQQLAAVRASEVLAYLVTPLSFMQAAVAPALLHMLFKSRWDGSIPLIQILSIGLPGDAICWIGTALLIARRQFRRDFQYNLCFSALFFIFVLAGVYFQRELGVAIAVSAYYMLLKPVNSWLILKESIKFRDFINIYILPSALSAIAFAPLYLIYIYSMSKDALIGLIFIGLLGPIIYIICVRMCSPRVLLDIINRFRIRPFARFLRFSVSADAP